MSVFEHHNGLLGVQASVLYDELGLITYDAYQKRKSRGTLIETRRACKGYPALVKFETLPDDWKMILRKKFGDPYKTYSDNLFYNLIEINQSAVEYYRTYRYNENCSLSDEKQREYVINASIITTVRREINNRKVWCKSLGGYAKKVWPSVSAYVNALDRVKMPHSLPSNPRSLERLVSRFNKEGFYALVHKNYGNQHSEKLSPVAQEWILSRWADRVNKTPGIQHLFFQFNSIAAVNGWKPLTDAKTIYNYLHRPEVKPIWWGHRYGELKAKEKFNFQHSTRMPTMRDGLWYSDGTKLNYFYRKEDGSIGTCLVYEIMDAYSEVLLGYCISDSEDYKTQYTAFKMAVQFSGHRPYQLGFDNQGGHKKLIAGSFLSKVAKLAIKTQPYNGKSKTIESAFNRFQSQYLKRDWFFTGMNIQAKSRESKANLEFINSNKGNLPTLAEIKAIYKQRRDEWNNDKHFASDKARLEMYQASLNERCPKVELWDMVDIFWLLREEPVSYNAYGLTFKDKNRKHTFTVYSDNGLPDIKWHGKNIDRKFWIKYDPEDMSIIYLYDKDSKGNLRFVREARPKIEIARGKQEQESFETAYIAAIKKMNDEARVERVDKMDEIQKALKMDVESYGFNKPAILGLNSKKRKVKPVNTDFGKVLKAQSNVNKNNIDEDPEEFNIYDRM